MVKECHLTDIEASAELEHHNSVLAARAGDLKYKLEPANLPRLLVYENEIWRGEPDAPGSIGGSIAGARAEVLTQGQNTSRVTAGRIFMLGVFALAAQKKTGSQHYVLKIVAPGFEITYLPVAEASTKQLEVFTTIADFIANRGRQLQPAVSPGSSRADELSKWAGLHSSGVISDDEFAVKKAELLA
jgi:hypothetical protein